MLKSTNGKENPQLPLKNSKKGVQHFTLAFFKADQSATDQAKVFKAFKVHVHAMITEQITLWKKNLFMLLTSFSFKEIL